MGGAVFLIVFLGAVAGCATKADVRDLRDEILELSSQQQALLRELQEAQQDQEDSISEVARTLQDIRAESFSRMSSIEDQLLTIQELAGLSQQQVASLRDQMERDRAQRSFAPTRAFGTDAAGGEDQVREVYDAALNQYQRGTLGAARLGFRQIVDQYGSHELAPEARYYLAEILQREGSLEEAIEAFDEIAQFHPTAPRVPDALYRVGLLHLELGNREEAEQSLERVVNTWPDSMAADLARDELRDL
jgi:tol-pal system protein YbgF